MMSSKEIQELEDMYDRVKKEEETTTLLKNAERPQMKPKRARREPNVSMSGKIFSKPKKYSKLLEMRENLAKAKEIRRRLRNQSDEDEDDYKSTTTTTSSGSDGSVTSKDFTPPVETVDSDEELLTTFESLSNPEPITINQSINNFVGIDGFPAIKDQSSLLPGELFPNPETLYQDLENNDALYREVFEQSPNQNMGEILTPIVIDYEEHPIDMEELYDLALIETDEQIYEENYLRHSMALAVFEDKNIDELKELLENVKKQPL